MEELTHIRAAIVAAHRAIACEKAARIEPAKAGMWMEVAAREHVKKRRALEEFEHRSVGALRAQGAD